MRKSKRPSEVFPERLAAARELRGLSQAELARKAKLQPSAISHFEAGSRKPSLDNLRRLADALEVATDYLIGRSSSIGESATEPTDAMYRHLQNLSSEDRDLARDLMESLSKRAKARARKDER